MKVGQSYRGRRLCGSSVAVGAADRRRLYQPMIAGRQRRIAALVARRNTVACIYSIVHTRVLSNLHIGPKLSQTVSTTLRNFQP